MTDKESTFSLSVSALVDLATAKSSYINEPVRMRMRILACPIHMSMCLNAIAWVCVSFSPLVELISSRKPTITDGPKVSVVDKRAQRT
jgi:hypothetical protein